MSRPLDWHIPGPLEIFAEQVLPLWDQVEWNCLLNSQCLFILNQVHWISIQRALSRISQTFLVTNLWKNVHVHMHMYFASDFDGLMDPWTVKKPCWENAWMVEKKLKWIWASGLESRDIHHGGCCLWCETSQVLQRTSMTSIFTTTFQLDRANETVILTVQMLVTAARIQPTTSLFITYVKLACYSILLILCLFCEVEMIIMRIMIRRTLVVHWVVVKIQWHILLKH